MIKSITILANSNKKSIDFSRNETSKIVIDCNQFAKNNNSFDIEIVFNVPIISLRNHDYTWVDLKSNRVANSFCPKILKLENGFIIQSNITDGIWEFNNKTPKQLLWRFNPEYSKPLAVYLGDQNSKSIYQANSGFSFLENPTLLFSQKNGLEISRSKIPFSAIACFTDHCDFDTLENLKLQREFFKKNEIKVTKGFFLNHFSKRSDNASLQNDKQELLLWREDGHELCYHSLSQSIKSDEESFQDFRDFIPPFSDLKVWIDHGYQPYNFSLLEKNKNRNLQYENNLKNKNISVLWNYIDSGTSTQNVLNQLNTNNFTLEKYLKGIKSLSFKKKIQLMIKNIFFHYYANETLLIKYKNLASNFKTVFIKREYKKFSGFVKNVFQVSKPLLKILINWKSIKNQPYKLAKYSPLIFKHKINNEHFTIFQTIEMLDFVASLNKKSINDFVHEKGVFIAHTYFSVTMNYHSGRLIVNNKINSKVEENFEFLSQKIKSNEIWNPTLSELIDYYSIFESAVVDIDENGVIFMKNVTNLHSRSIN